MFDDKQIKRLYMDDATKEDFEKVWFKDFHRKQTNPVEIIENGIISPSFNSASGGIFGAECGVLDSQNNYVQGSGMFEIPIPGDAVIPQNIETIDKEVIFCGRLLLHYGHFLLQSTSRLYHYIKNKDKNPYIAFTIGKGEKIPKFANEFFELLEIPKDKIILVKDWTRFRKIICPPISSVVRYKTAPKFSSENYCDWTDDFLLPFSQAAKKVAPAEYKKVYLTRRYWTDIVQCLGEKDIEKVFVKNGFKSIAPERLSLKEQIALIKGAEQIAGINGSPFHTAIFCDRPNLKMIILNRNEEFDFQYIVNEAIKADCYVINASANPFKVSESNGPFIMGITRYLKEFLNDHDMQDFGIRLDISKYVKDFFCLYSKIYALPYYSNTLINTQKGKLNIGDVVGAFGISAYSLWDRIIYFILYHITFGTLKIKYKNRHRAICSFKLQKKKMDWTFLNEDKND